MSIDIDYSLEPHELDMMEILLPEFYNCQTVGPRFRDMNWDEEFAKDMITGKGFVVKAKPFKKKLKDKDGSIMSRGIKEMDGIHSPRFGSDWNDENAFAERYSCECGKTIGRIYEGYRCPYCDTRVRFVDVDLSLYAWIKINQPQFCIIHPLLYRKISVFMGSKSKTLERIINFKMDMTIDGEFRPLPDFNYNKEPFFGIGMLEFRRRFDEIMEYYRRKKKDKSDLYKHIMANRDKVFTTAVPVYSAILRQVFFTDEDYSYTKIDKCYNALYGNVKRLNEETEVNSRNYAKINLNLFRAQRNVCSAFDLIFTSLTEKEGLVRRQILGGRINFSARTVITPNARLRSYQIELPYVAFVELFKEQIINLLVKMDGMSFNDAVELWFRAYTEFNPKVYKVIEYILKHTKGHARTLLNRNPTIKHGSFLCMEIAHVKKDYDDLSAGLPIQCLSSLNADFDGDTLNTVKLIGNEMKKSFSRVFSPRTGFLLSKNDGELNKDFALLKDQMIALREFCSC